MHFRPFSVKKKSDFSDFFPISPIFDQFFDDLLKIGLLPPLRFPTGPPLSFYVTNMQKIGKNSDFRCRPPKKGFQILNLHPKKHTFKKKKPFFYVLLPK